MPFMFMTTKMGKLKGNIDHLKSILPILLTLMFREIVASFNQLVALTNYYFGISIPESKSLLVPPCFETKGGPHGLAI